MLKRSPLKRYTRLKPRRSKPRIHKFIVRLTGEALEKLRLEVWRRDQGICQNCGTRAIFRPRFTGDPMAYDLAHIRSRGACGSDTPENTRVLHHGCHMAEHSKGRTA